LGLLRAAPTMSNSELQGQLDERSFRGWFH